MGGCCNGSCPINQCRCYAYDPNWKPQKFGLTISLIETGLQLFDSDSVKSRKHGKECLEEAIILLREFEKIGE